MNSAWKTTAKTAILLTVILLLSAAVAILATDQSNPEYGDFDESYRYEDDWEGFSDNLPSYDADIQAAHASGGTIGGGSGRVSGSSSGAQDLVAANGLVMELRRIVRAGRSMDVLRNNSNPVLKRRCYQGMQKLQKETLSIKARRKNLAIRASSESVSLGKVFSNVMKCISCDSDAILSCNIAQQDLDIIIRSLSLN